MAKIIGGVTSSHIPAVGNAIANNLQQEPYWKRFFDGYKPAQDWLQKHKPDIAIVVYNDHGLNFFLDKVPTFALGCADTYDNADEGWALKPVAPFKGNANVQDNAIAGGRVAIEGTVKDKDGSALGSIKVSARRVANP